jgi:CopG family nickel-responsive transcriptional regulator
MSTSLSRFSVSLPSSLLKDLDQMVQQKGYTNRSLAIADMIRDGLVSHRQQGGHGEVAGTITLLFDHHRSHVQETLTSVQHEHLHQVISTFHVHLDHDNCLEVIVVRGNAKLVKKLADRLIAARGVKHGKLTVTSVGSDLVV